MQSGRPTLQDSAFLFQTPVPFLPAMALPRRARVRLNRLRTGVVRFSSSLYNWVWLPLWPVSVSQKNKPLTMLSSNVQSTDLLMDCMAWRFWMRQPNGCSTPAPKSSAVKQWIEEKLAQKKAKIFVYTKACVHWLQPQLEVWLCLLQRQACLLQRQAIRRISV